MIESKHTPGPWIVDTDHIIQDGGTSDENTIAIVGDQEEWKANARLIAAAPDLLEALKHARGFIIRYGTIKEGAGFVDSPHFNSIYEKISSATQKAGVQG